MHALADSQQLTHSATYRLSPHLAYELDMVCAVRNMLGEAECSKNAVLAEALELFLATNPVQKEHRRAIEGFRAAKRSAA